MGSKIIGDEGHELESDEEKANHLALRNFKWAEKTMVEEGEEVEIRHRDKGLVCHGHEGTNYVTRPWARDKATLELRLARTISLAHGQVIKVTFEYTKKNNHTCLGQVSLRNCITRP